LLFAKRCGRGGRGSERACEKSPRALERLSNNSLTAL
jgi:hypothetical protein